MLLKASFGFLSTESGNNSSGELRRFFSDLYKAEQIIQFLGLITLSNKTSFGFQRGKDKMVLESLKHLKMTNVLGWKGTVHYSSLHKQA